MDKIRKALQKLSSKERERIKDALRRLNAEELEGLDIKKLKGRTDIFRVRIGDLRVIYQQLKGDIVILRIDRRKEDTYKF